LAVAVPPRLLVTVTVNGLFLTVMVKLQFPGLTKVMGVLVTGFCPVAEMLRRTLGSLDVVVAVTVSVVEPFLLFPTAEVITMVSFVPVGVGVGVGVVEVVTGGGRVLGGGQTVVTGAVAPGQGLS